MESNLWFLSKSQSRPVCLQKCWLRTSTVGDDPAFSGQSITSSFTGCSTWQRGEWPQNREACRKRTLILHGHRNCRPKSGAKQAAPTLKFSVVLAFAETVAASCPPFLRFGHLSSQGE